VKLRRFWVRTLLRLYPRAFRRAYERELLDLYTDIGLHGIHLTWDLIVNAVLVRFDDSRGASVRTPRTGRRWRFGDGWRADLGSSWRAFARRPAFSLLVVLTLALGIGANTAIFAVTEWVVLRPLPFPRPEEVVRVWWRPDSFNQRIVALFQERATSFSSLAAFSGWSFTLTGEGEPEELSGAVVSPNYFSVLGVDAVLGRTFVLSEENPGQTDVCVLSEGLWKRRFGGDEGVLGRRIPTETPPRANFRVISPGYFGAMGVPVLEGRDLTDADRSGGPPVGLVNQKLAREIWPNESALGKEVHVFGPSGPAFTVVGVVGDVHQHGLAIEPSPEMYRPLEQWSLGRNYMMVRTAVEPERLVAAVRDTIWSVDADVPIVRLSPMNEVVSGSIAASRLTAVLVSAFAALALALAAIGVYGVASSIVTARVRQIGIRMALGAGGGSVLRRALVQGMFPVAPGVLAGAIIASTASRALDGLLVDARAPGPLTFLAIAVFLAAVTLLACYLPARRASRVDPVTVLRRE
jgi:hypothetical protein